MENNFKSGLASLPIYFPIANWCWLTEQADNILNMLQTCKQNLILSAYESMEGVFHFDATPMAPLGTKVYIHEKPYMRSECGFNAHNGWYIRQSKKYYICFKVAMASMAADQVSDTIWFDHHAVSILAFKSVDRIVAGTKHLKYAIQKKPPTAPPEELAAVHQLQAEILREKTPIQKTPLAPTMEVVPPIQHITKTRYSKVVNIKWPTGLSRNINEGTIQYRRVSYSNK